MEKLKMQSMDKVQEHIKAIAQMFPNAVTETKNSVGGVQRKLNFDVLKQELADYIVDKRQQRYQFTWPDKNKAILTANKPINKTLRPCRAESLDFDNTENLYIEGDNLEVLKLLQETYLGKVKMIYIDPPYNTGKDFIYEDDFRQDADEYKENSGQYDDEGNRLVQNTESNGRFHTDWLNMMYPRLKLARDLLSDDGVIFISIDEHEDFRLEFICNEIFGSNNKLGTIIWDKRNPKGSVVGVAYQHESILVYSKNKNIFATVDFKQKKENAKKMISFVNKLIKKYGQVNENLRKEYAKWLNSNQNILSGGESSYKYIDIYGNIYGSVSMGAPDKPQNRSHRPLIHPVTKKPCPVPNKGWRYKDNTMDDLLKSNKIIFGIDETTQPRQKYYLKDNLLEAVSSLIYFGGQAFTLDLPFDTAKPLEIIYRLLFSVTHDKNNSDIILDFFSGSATTAHAIMQLNAEDGGKRKFIMVQLPERTPADSEAAKAGYNTICEIGKERIRRAGKKIKEEFGDKTADLDTGFRVLKVDSSNMKDVFYSPADYRQDQLDSYIDNIKPDRTGEDLLFQVMLDMGIALDSSIVIEEIAGKCVYNVADNFLLACFDMDVTDEVITAIAKKQPDYVVLRDFGMVDDAVAVNFEQIFKTYSPHTIAKVL